MKSNNITSQVRETIEYKMSFMGFENSVVRRVNSRRFDHHIQPKLKPTLPEILVITSYPPRECGIATYSEDLILALNNKFDGSLTIKVCAIESGVTENVYPDIVKLKLDTTHFASYKKLAKSINEDQNIEVVLIQHEFGFFKKEESAFLNLLYEISKPIITVFHTVLPNPDDKLKLMVKNIVAACKSIIVMTNTSAQILKKDYGVATQKIEVIPHGTHLVPHLSEVFLKDKHNLTGRKVLTTFGLLSAGKSIETTLQALPAIIKKCPEVMFLVIGKTHPEVVKNEKEQYRDSLEEMTDKLGIRNNVMFINKYLSLPKLLEYLQLTDIYLFTTNDPNQAVSGTFVYAMSCACPIISTPIPHAKEVLTKDTGLIFDFKDSKQLSENVINLLEDKNLRKHISTNTLQAIISTAWENSAVAHAMLLEKTSSSKITLQYNMPDLNLNHLQSMTTDFAMIQFSKINQPDIESGYTIDDNARALITTCMYLKTSGDKKSIPAIKQYLAFIKYCQQPEGNFLNYVDKDQNFTAQNAEVNLDDSNGRALWALGYLISMKDALPIEIITEAIVIFESALSTMHNVKSPRSMAFIIKGIYYAQIKLKSKANIALVNAYANRLMLMYKHESNFKWEWFESYLTYANSILSESMVYAWLMTSESTYKDIALTSFNFLLSHTFNSEGINVISNRNWFRKGHERGKFGEQPIDVAYTIMSLSLFYEVFNDHDYKLKMETAFNWFLGNNRLHQIVYNPCTGGCYDGLEETHVNLNQGAESTLSYLMARLTLDKYQDEK